MSLLRVSFHLSVFRRTVIGVQTYTVQRLLLHSPDVANAMNGK